MRLKEHLAAIWAQTPPEIKALGEAEVIIPFSCVPEDWFYSDKAILAWEDEVVVVEYYGDDEPNWYHGFYISRA